MKIYNVTVNVKKTFNLVRDREDVSLWVAASTPEKAISKARQHVRKAFDDKRGRIEGAMLVGTVDVL